MARFRYGQRAEGKEAAEAQMILNHKPAIELLVDQAEEVGFEQAFFVMVQLPYLQPFADVNKRVSRLGVNLPLVKHNLCPLPFIDVPLKAYVEGLLGVYELNRVDLLRDVFLWAYERSSRRYKSVRESLGEPDPFRLRYAATWRRSCDTSSGAAARRGRPRSGRLPGRACPPTIWTGSSRWHSARY